MNQFKFSSVKLPPWIVRHGLTVLAIASFLGLLAVEYLSYSWAGPTGDPDRWFHLALARESAHQGIWFFRQLPQIAGLGWQLEFPDKEPLFHIIGSGLYRLGGDAAVLAMPQIFGILLVLLVFQLLRKSKLSWQAALLLSVHGLVAYSYFFYRYSLLRPHTLGILCFIAIYWALTKRSKPLVLITSFIFALAYHAIYMPIALFALATAIEFPHRERMLAALKFLAIGFIGITAGTILSPSFPGNIIMTLRHLRIALFEVNGGKLPFGGELYPMTTAVFLKQHLGTVAIIALGLIEILRRKNTDTLLRTLLASAILFFAISMHSPRAQEYLIPFITLLTGHLLQLWLPKKMEPIQFKLELAVITFACAFPIWNSLGMAPFGKFEKYDFKANEPYFTALRSLPQEKPRIFNMEWDSTPSLLFARADVRFLDLLDPSFLLEHSPDLHQGRNSIASHQITDIYSYIRSAFQADYILTGSSELRSFLELDPHFARVFPEKIGGLIAWSHLGLFEVLPESHEHFVLGWEKIRVSDKIPLSIFLNLTPQSPELRSEQASKVLPEVPKKYIQPSYVDLKKLINSKAGAPPTNQHELENWMDDIYCVSMEPASDQSKLWDGAQMIGIGGGRNQRVWLNGKPLYHSKVASDFPRVVSKVLRLSHPLKKTDRIEILTCSKNSSPFMGVSLSFWKEKQLTELCKKKRWTPPQTFQDSRPWELLGDIESTCIGEIARKP